MKAAVYYESGGPEVFRYEDVPDPECPPHHVVIDVEVVSVEGGDLLYRWGQPPPSKPWVVGYQAAGVICEVGEGVSERQVGQRVVTIFPAGSHASKRCVVWSVAFPIPDTLATDKAATIPIPFGTASDCLFEYASVAPIIEQLIEDVDKGELQAVVDRSFPLAEAAEAHRYIESRQAFGRVLLIP